MTIEEIKNSLTEYEKNTVHTDKFMEIVWKYQDCEEITTPMLNEFIEKIVMHEADKSVGRMNRKQKVDIYFNFVGQIDLSEPTKQEESIAKPTAKKGESFIGYTEKVMTVTVIAFFVAVITAENETGF